MRLVDADALKAIRFHDLPYSQIVPADCDTDEKVYAYKLGWNDAIDAIVESAPTIEPTLQHVESVGEDGSALKHGHWKEVQRIRETDHTAICECSLCGDTVWVYDGQRAWNYCPKCGAKMDEVAE